MGGGTFIWLKGARIGPKSAKQAETGLDIFVKTLAIGSFLGRSPGTGAAMEPARVVSVTILPDMANVPGIGGFVIQITVLARKLLHYPVGICGEKMMQIASSKSIHGTTSADLILAPQVDVILTVSTGNSCPSEGLCAMNIGSQSRIARLHKQEMVSQRTHR
jgi:hypothetical protein